MRRATTPCTAQCSPTGARKAGSSFTNSCSSPSKRCQARSCAWTTASGAPSAWRMRSIGPCWKCQRPSDRSLRTACMCVSVFTAGRTARSRKDRRGPRQGRRARAAPQRGRRPPEGGRREATQGVFHINPAGVGGPAATGWRRARSATRAPAAHRRCATRRAPVRRAGCGSARCGRPALHSLHGAC